MEIKHYTDPLIDISLISLVGDDMPDRSIHESAPAGFARVLRLSHTV
jgi:hypothetical protein